MKSFYRAFLLLSFSACVACSSQLRFEWDSRLEGLKSELLSEACNSEHRARFEELIASQSLVLSYEEMERSLQNMQRKIRCN